MHMCKAVNDPEPSGGVISQKCQGEPKISGVRIKRLSVFAHVSASVFLHFFILVMAEQMIKIWQKRWQAYCFGS